MRHEKIYISHINALDNKQDTSCFILFIEDILNYIKRILTKINLMIVQSDNTKLYQNSIVPFSFTCSAYQLDSLLIIIFTQI